MVYERIHVLGPQKERCHHFAIVDCLVPAVDDSALDEPQKPVGEHLGMESEVLVSSKLGGEGVRKGSDAHLDAVSVLHKRGAVLSDQHLGGGGLGKAGGHQRGVVAHQIVELVQAYQVAVCKGHIGVYHSYNYIGALDGGYRAVNGGAEADHPVLIGQRDIHQGGSKLDETAAVELLALSKMHGKIVRVARIHILADIGTHEETLLEELAFVGGVAVGGRTLGMEVMEMQVCDVPGVGAAAESLNKTVGNACHAAQVDVAAGRDVAYRFIGRNEIKGLHKKIIVKFAPQKY